MAGKPKRKQYVAKRQKPDPKRAPKPRRPAPRRNHLAGERSRLHRARVRAVMRSVVMVEPAQLERLLAVLGSPIIITYRLATERPIVRKTTAP